MFEWLKKPRQAVRRVQPWRPQEIRLVEWQANDKLVGEAKRRLGDVMGRTMCEVLRVESPAMWLLATNATVEQRAAHQAQIEGYHLCLNNLEALMVYRPVPTALEETWEPESAPSTTPQ